MSNSVMEQIAARYKVKVTKLKPDDRKHLCGEPAQKGQDGREFFIIPVHQADYIRDIFKQYEVGPPFDPEAGQYKPNQHLDKLVEAHEQQPPASTEPTPPPATDTPAPPAAEQEQGQEAGEKKTDGYPCQVPGCNYVAETPGKLGSHMRWGHGKEKE